jgi:glycosyltransferase involved in cell wall biosynthesis
MPAVSVVIPLYNKEPYITRALNSVLNQKFRDFEVIVVDDGSTDNGAEVVKGFHDLRIRLIQQENKGVSAARNRAIDDAEGELIAFLDADDAWVPSFLDTALCLHKKYPEAGMLIQAHIVIDEMNTVQRKKYISIPDHPWHGILPNYFKSVTLDWTLVSTSSVCVPKCILIETGLFKINIVWGEDEDLWGRIALKHPVVYCTYIGSIRYLVESKIIGIKRRAIYQKVHPFISEANNKLSENSVPDSILEDLKEYIAYCQIQTITHNLDIGDRVFAKKILKECTTHRFKIEKIWYFLWSSVPSKLYENAGIIKFRKAVIYIFKGW